MKILGIGNAIVDVICKVEDSFLKDNVLTKSTMKLVDETEFKKLLSNLKIEETIAGGSVANSIVGLSQLGNDVGFIGKVNDDDLGNKYEDGLKKEKVKYFYSKKKEELPTGKATPRSQESSMDVLFLKLFLFILLIISEINFLLLCFLRFNNISFLTD